MFAGISNFLFASFCEYLNNNQHMIVFTCDNIPIKTFGKYVTERQRMNCIGPFKRYLKNNSVCDKIFIKHLPKVEKTFLVKTYDLNFNCIASCCSVARASQVLKSRDFLAIRCMVVSGLRTNEYNTHCCGLITWNCFVSLLCSVCQCSAQANMLMRRTQLGI